MESYVAFINKLKLYLHNTDNLIGGIVSLQEQDTIDHSLERPTIDKCYMGASSFVESKKGERMTSI